MQNNKNFTEAHQIPFMEMHWFSLVVKSGLSKSQFEFSELRSTSMKLPPTLVAY